MRAAAGAAAARNARRRDFFDIAEQWEVRHVGNLIVAIVPTIGR